MCYTNKENTVKKTSIMNVRVSVPQRAQLDDLAKRRQLTTAQIIRSAVSQYLRSQYRLSVLPPENLARITNAFKWTDADWAAIQMAKPNPMLTDEQWVEAFDRMRMLIELTTATSPDAE